MRWPIGAKFCTVVSTRPNFIMSVKNSGGLPQKNFRGKKTCKIGPISDDFEVRRRISPERMKIFEIGEVHYLNVESYPSKAHFSEDHISALRGCCAPKFLHALENDQ